MLHRLFYRSRQTSATVMNLDAVVRQIIGGAIPANRSLGVTGLLLTAKGSFVQVLEGGEDRVRATYARIRSDPRHYDSHIIAQGPAEQRLFGDWNMCARALGPSDKSILEVLDGWSGFNPQTLTGDSVERLLTSVSAIQRRVASEAAEN